MANINARRMDNGKGRWACSFFLLTLIFFSTGRMSAQNINISNPANAVGLQKADSSIKMDTQQAIKFIDRIYKRRDLWNEPNGEFRNSLGQLIYHLNNPPFSSSEELLRSFPYDSIKVPYENFYIWDTLRVEFPFNRNDTASMSAIDSILSGIHTLRKDTILLVVVDTLTEVASHYNASIFRHYNNPFEADSIVTAIGVLLDEVERRDSATIFFRTPSGQIVPVVSNSRTGQASRLWLRNEYNDSITVWIGSDSRDIFSLFVEEGLIFRRPGKQTNIQSAQVGRLDIDHSRLSEVKKYYIKPVYWKVRYETNFILNQTFLSNWVKGGESNLSMVGDITGYADYIKKEENLAFTNFARLKYGLVASTENGVRKNIDLLETSSKLNHKAFGKFDFSSTAQIKTQIARGYSYTKISGVDTSILVSKFFNPVTMTVGFGLDYKPTKELSVNIAPLTYKVTYVSDTASIDQTKYGIDADRKARHEPGVGVIINHKFNPFETVQITNRVQLFTNYIKNPQNVDIDWELTASMKINWFTEIRLNTHFIYDDDTRTKIYRDGAAVLGPDGKPKVVARTQFKEVIGFSFVFKF